MELARTRFLAAADLIARSLAQISVARLCCSWRLLARSFAMRVSAPLLARRTSIQISWRIFKSDKPEIRIGISTRAYTRASHADGRRSGQAITAFAQDRPPHDRAWRPHRASHRPPASRGAGRPSRVHFTRPIGGGHVRATKGHYVSDLPRHRYSDFRVIKNIIVYRQSRFGRHDQS